ncbi:MAG: efflux RND transporter permease subunit [Pelovirga sp.]
MRQGIFNLYHRTVLAHPLITLLVTLLLVLAVGSFARNFHLDASADSLMLEHDEDLKYYRAIHERYGTSEFLIISYSPQEDLLAPATLADLRNLRDRLLEIERVTQVLSILDAPLIDSPRVTRAELSRGIRTIDAEDIDLELVREEFTTSPLYRDLLVSADGRTTALQVLFADNEELQSLLRQRNALRDKQYEGTLSRAEQQQLAAVSADYDRLNRAYADRQARDIATIRTIMDDHRDTATLHLGGVPMIVADMIDFIRSDLVNFGLGVLVFLVAMLILIFRRWHWVALPMACCFAAVFFMFGFLGLLDWKVTVVSSNFTSLLLIITLSLCVHLIVRYNELLVEQPQADHATLVGEMVRTKAIPSIFTALTTIAAFASLLTSDIRPIIDFGWMMAIGIGFALVLSLVLFPATLLLLKKPARFVPRIDITGLITSTCVHLVERRRRATLTAFGLITLVSLYGISTLTVENRFIDYFKPTTEIYQGMELIDRQLGGTTPLDVIIDADPDFFSSRAQSDSGVDDDPFDDDFFADEDVEAGLSGDSYWYNSYQVDQIHGIHRYLDGLHETGKVLSMSTTFSLMQQINEDQPLDNISLAVIHRVLPEIIEKSLFRPYMAEDGNQIRFSIRVIDSDPDLRRNQLLNQIREDLVTDFDLLPEQIQLTGMFVLYNNVLQSLFTSQIMTIGVVFLVIVAMFLVQFRSLRLALISIVPNLISAAVVLGLMGLMQIPLDIMTITIAAITIGIAVDDTIHYVHRYIEELRRDDDPLAAIRRTHDSVGRAMYYTSVTVITGFSILTLSNFNPTIYFGLFTGLAMLVAMFANLTLLALLLLIWQPRHHHPGRKKLVSD